MTKKKTTPKTTAKKVTPKTTAKKTTTKYQPKTVTGTVSLPNPRNPRYLEFAVGHAIAKVGDTVRIPVAISNNPGIWAFILNCSWDTSALEFISVETAGSFTAANCLSNSTKVVVDAKEMANFHYEGTVFWYTFRVKKAGTTNINFYAPDADSNIDVDFNNVTTAFTNGYISAS